MHVSHARTSEPATLDRTESGRHRASGSVGPAGRPATWVTAAIAVATLGVAGYAGTSSVESPDSLSGQARQAQANLSGAAPVVAAKAGESMRDRMQQQRTAHGWLRIGRTVERISALATSQQSVTVGVNAAQQRSAEIAAEREADAEQEAAQEAAAQEAAEQEEAQEAAAEREAEQVSASRSQERSEAPEPESEPAPVSSGDPRSIARSMLDGYGWSSDQFGCLESLWSKESGWNTYAQNASSGAYGIPQSLPGSKMASAGSDWRSNPATQIRWGLGYISGRYGSPCSAWSHSQANNWY